MRLLAAFADARPGAPPRSAVEPLTDREEEVLRAVARGRTNSEIADELFISLSTVKTHLTSLMAKLGAATGSRSRCGRAPDDRPTAS